MMAHQVLQFASLYNQTLKEEERKGKEITKKEEEKKTTNKVKREITTLDITNK
jgi:hypothetical protein